VGSHSADPGGDRLARLAQWVAEVNAEIGTKHVVIVLGSLTVGGTAVRIIGYLFAPHTGLLA